MHSHQSLLPKARPFGTLGTIAYSIQRVSTYRVFVTLSYITIMLACVMATSTLGWPKEPSHHCLPTVHQGTRRVLCWPLLPIAILVFHSVLAIIAAMLSGALCGRVTVIRVVVAMATLLWAQFVAPTTHRYAINLAEAAMLNFEAHHNPSNYSGLYSGTLPKGSVSGVGYYPTFLSLTLMVIIISDLYALAACIAGVRPFRLGAGFDYCNLCRNHWIVDYGGHVCPLADYGTLRQHQGEAAATIVSRWTFSWLNGFMQHAARNPDYVQDSTIPRLLPTQTTAYILGCLPDRKKQVPSQAGSTATSFRNSIGWRFLSSTKGRLFFYIIPLKVILAILSFAAPVIVGRLVRFVKLSDEPVLTGALLCFELGVVLIAQAFFFQIFLAYLYDVSLACTSALKAEVLRKSAMFANHQRREAYDDGTIVSLTTVDVTRIADSLIFLHNLWGNPLTLILCLVFLKTYIGWIATIASFLAVAALIPVNSWLVKALQRTQSAVVQQTATRIGLINETFNAIRTVKMSGWEPFFGEKIRAARIDEFSKEQDVVRVQALTALVNECTAASVASVSFFVYYMTGGEMVAEVLVPTLAVLNLLKFPIWSLPGLLSVTSRALVSVRRVDAYLAAEEGSTLRQSPELPLGTISIKGANFFWRASQKTPTLENVFLHIKPRQQVVVIGKVGSGKTALLHGILGEMYSTEVAKGFGTVAYCHENPWIRDITVRENILMGKQFDQERYDEVLKACALDIDMDRLPEGDQTIVGDRGLVLSGGQKARVALARAVYSEADIYLLDSIFSALDEQVQSHIATHVLEDLLAEKTVIIVAHIVPEDYVPDRVFVLENKTVVEVEVESNWRGVNPNPSGRASPSVSPTRRSSLASFPVRSRSPTPMPALPKENSELALYKQDSDRTFAYKTYFTFMGAKLPIITILSLIAQGLQTGADAWLAIWISRQLTATSTFLFIYLFLSVSSSAVSALRTLIFFRGCYNSATRIHIEAVSLLLSAPMSFYDVSPIGKLTNILSKDQDTVDQAVPESLDLLISSTLKLVAVLMFNIYLNSIFVIVTPLLINLFMKITRHYLAVSTEARRLENTSRGNTTSLQREVLRGSSTIRAMKLLPALETEYHQLQDGTSRATNLSNALARWVGLRLEFVSSFAVLFCSIVMVTFRHSISPAFAGIAIVSILNVSKSLLMLCRRVGMFEVQFMSVEQLTGLLKNIEPEKGLRTAGSAGDEILAELDTNPSLEFRHVTAHYRQNLPPVLKDMSFQIPPASKIGIIGRTGSGKTTLFNAILQLMDQIDGSILIGGIDCKLVSKQQLRLKISTIPQEPTLLQGSIRMNLSPVATVSDEYLWSVLGRVSLTDKIKACGGLDAKVEQDGRNFSAGERQLICLARALLRNSKLILMDEVTSNIDSATDRILQQVLRTEFSNCTRLTIAHRLETVTASDYILVVGTNGTVEAFAPPQEVQKRITKIDKLIES